MRTTEDEHLDVLIVGAGLSGIGAACHLRRDAPERSFAILEARDDLGGTWDLFRYPGIRSDSDMHTLAYPFSPWREPEALADGPSILAYLRRAADEYGVGEQIRFGRRVVAAHWSSRRARWTVQALRADGEVERISCSFLLCCCGYYDYDGGYAPAFAGAERFRGPIVHPQRWPDDLDYDDRRVVVIGSGATAVTIVPALARRAAHVTMLQRSPSYVVALAARDPLAQRVRRWLPETVADRLIRAKNIGLMTLSFQLSRRRPALMKALLRRGVRAALPAGFDVETHFGPRYDPWDQRLCVAPDGDLFRALSEGRASIVTDTIKTFTEDGIELTGGQTLAADVIVTATGLRLQALGGIQLSVDDREVAVPETTVYMGSMLSGVPSFAFVMGYTNASWTLRADLTLAFVTRVLRYMRERGWDWCMPSQPPAGTPRLPLLDLSSGYVRRSVAEFPAQGAAAPWRVRQNYFLDRLELRRHRIDDGVLRFGVAPAADHAGSDTLAAAA
ncbi:MAG TPA: NAD(P)/FAD-dependent oxidoreductase [Solirubrobacteraceae bacterium]|nr:NAD(P)/FAD-dependent oxidoreductase [Solirubrobacteraceae bacterium]